MKKIYLLIALVFGLSACTSKEQLKKTLVENPDVLIEAIKANPAEFMTALQEASQLARTQGELKAVEDKIDNPYSPEISEEDILVGEKDAPLTLVVYSDFQCPFCSRGNANEKALVEKYGDKIKVIFKHVPLEIHPQAMIAAQYYEAIRNQSRELAEKFHAELFENQEEIKKGESFLKKVAKEVGADMGKVAKDINSDAVKKEIQSDMAEHQKFGFRGTPGYLINGIPVAGAYPVDHFVGIIEKLQEKGKVSL